jgi:hypothetical protein
VARAYLNPIFCGVTPNAYSSSPLNPEQVFARSAALVGEAVVLTFQAQVPFAAAAETVVVAHVVEEVI